MAPVPDLSLPGRSLWGPFQCKPAWLPEGLQRAQGLGASQLELIPALGRPQGRASLANLVRERIDQGSSSAPPLRLGALSESPTHLQIHAFNLQQVWMDSVTLRGFIFWGKK